MRSGAPFPRWRLAAVRTVKVFVAAAVLAILVFLPFAGRFFSHNEPLQHSDLIVVLAGSRLDRWLEALDLYKEGWAPKIVVSSGPVSPLEGPLRERGLRYPREGDLARDAMVSLGLPEDAVTVMPNGVDNTAAEAAMLRRMLPPGSVRRVIVVTSAYHVRRAGYAFRREFKGTGVEIVMRGSRYTLAKPARWWTQRGDIRYVLTEVPKYLAYLAGLGE
jgi:uncharacterized SAM-binding protein YcdF (DUF218 family)